MSGASPFRHRRIVGVSLKMYMSLARARGWLGEVAALARTGAAAGVDLFVAPDYLSLAAARELLDGTGVAWGAQDVFWEDAGAYTGEISAPLLAEVGCRYVEVGHAERRRLFGESDQVVAAKAAAAARAGLAPVLCIGEPAAGSVGDALAFCRGQLAPVFAALPAEAPLVVAYEPVWAIGAAQPAEPGYIREVSLGLRALLAGREARLIYGGSAGPGLFAGLEGSADGLFLGRFAHDTAALAAVLQEVSRH
jgi:triosephosphate isomerase